MGSSKNHSLLNNCSRYKSILFVNGGKTALAVNITPLVDGTCSQFFLQAMHARMVRTYACTVMYMSTGRFLHSSGHDFICKSVRSGQYCMPDTIASDNGNVGVKTNKQCPIRHTRRVGNTDTEWVLKYWHHGVGPCYKYQNGIKINTNFCKTSTVVLFLTPYKVNWFSVRCMWQPPCIFETPDFAVDQQKT